ncbi:uncharacterized protein LOC115633725 [Scaptodrosophila lebanonensis]|uniref:Uncharacterized protein LOC115633725 n=1 Tax=Drosophila lebanonensis TaxID=7225 RepID=A0A6J2UIL5_DROLE|nr:uncharacterized protein LOC115633725 [Scaptodrosophila lebanonensis]
MDTNTEDANARSNDLDENLAMEVTPIEDTPAATQQETTNESVEPVEGIEEEAPAEMVTYMDIPMEEDVTLEKPKRRYHLKDALKSRFSVGYSEKKNIVHKVHSDYEDEEFEEDSQNYIRSESSAMEEARHTKIFDENYNDIVAHDALDAFEETDYSNTETTDSTNSHKAVDTVGMKKHFLTNFEELPHLSEISEEEEEIGIDFTVSKPSSPNRNSEQVDEDKGAFVDPLTGDILSDSTDSTAEISDHHFEEMEEETEEQDDFFEPETESVHAMPIIEKEDDFNVFTNFTQSLLETTEQKKHVNLDLKYEFELYEIAHQTVEQLIDQIVKKSESVAPQNRLRKNLDKVKLINELSLVVERYIVEKHINIAILSKITDYFKRIKSTRTLMKLPPDIEHTEKLRYIHALQRVDHAKKIAAAAKKNNAYLNSATLMDLQYVQNIAMSTEVDLEVAMRNGILRKDSDFLKRVLNREFKLMADMRNEISDTRLALITRKHTLGRLDERIEHFEQITEDLSMTHFISIQNEVQALDKKIEERNAELKKLHSNYHMELHFLAHNREKTLSFENKLQLLREELKVKKKRQHDLRDMLFKLKLERGDIRRKCNELTYQGGLLAMPTLMFDYDDTVDKLKVKHASVQKLRDTFKDLSKRVGTVTMTIN